MRRRPRWLVRGCGVCLAAIALFVLLSAGSSTAPAGAARRLESRTSAGKCPGQGGPDTGTLTVTVTGEPAHPPPRIVVTGPDHFRATIHDSKTLCGLEPGAYTVVGEPVRLSPDDGNPGGSNLYATVTGSPAIVLAGQDT